MSGRLRLAAALGLGGLVVGLVLLSRDAGPLARAGARVELPDATPGVLDTLTVRGRRVEASVNGIVVQVGPGDDVWIASDGDAFPFRFDDDAEVEVEDHLLAVGRLRARGGRRWVDVSAWSRVEAEVRPPSGSGL